MRALGHVLSFLAFIVSVSWYFVAVGLVVTVCLVAVSPFVGLPNMRLTIPVSFSVDPEVYRVTPSSPVADQGTVRTFASALEASHSKLDKTVSPGRNLRSTFAGRSDFPPQSRGLFVGTAILLVVDAFAHLLGAGRASRRVPHACATANRSWPPTRRASGESRLR